MTNNFLCPHCSSDQTAKAGFTKNKKQRYYCRSCRRFSRAGAVNRPEGVRKEVKSRSGTASRSHLILELQAITQKLGRTPTTADIMRLSKMRRAFPLGHYYDVFGSFTEAVRRAGLKSRYKQEFDKDRLIGELRRLRKKLKRSLISRDVLAARGRGEVSSIYHFQRAFGSVPKAIAAAGANRQRFTKSEIIVYLNKLETELKRVPTGQDIRERFVPGETPSLKEIYKTFGSLRKARLAAGIAYRISKQRRSIYWQKYTPEELLDQMRRLARKIGRLPTDRDLNKGSKKKECASAETFRRMFGGLKEAYREMETRTF